MCGRFTFAATEEELRRLRGDLDFDVKIDASYNIAPTQTIFAELNDSPRHITSLKWGLVPFWAEDASIGNKMINARGETLLEKNSFKHPIKKKRCLIYADGFYEWKKINPKEKQPYYIKLASGEPFAFAGMWSQNNKATPDTLRTGVLITTEPNEIMSEIHNRMPVILQPEDYDFWLDDDAPIEDILNLAKFKILSEQLEIYPVSTIVNKPQNNFPELREPLSEAS